MRRIAALMLLGAMSVGCGVGAVAQTRTRVMPEDRASRKAERRQQKTTKKYAKAQRKAERKMLKTERKNTKRL